MFSPKIAVGTNGSVIHHKQVNAGKVKRERTVNDWYMFPFRKLLLATGMFLIYTLNADGKKYSNINMYAFIMERVE